MSFRQRLAKASDDIACTLVIDYLNRNDYQNVTKEILKVKNIEQFDIKGLDLIDVLEYHKKKTNAGKDDPDPGLTKVADDIACKLVIDYLTNHGYDNVARLVKKKKKVKEFDLHGLDLADLLNRSNPKNEKPKNCDQINATLEPPRKRSRMNSETENTKMCCALIVNYLKKTGYENLGKILQDDMQCQNVNLDGLSLFKIFQRLKTKEDQKDLLPKQDLGYDLTEEINQLVPLKDSFKDKLGSLANLESSENSELAKVTKYILAQNVFIKKSVALTLHLSSFLVIQNNLKNFPFLHCGGLSSVRYGDTSEESLLLKKWKDLIEKVPIFIPQRFLLDIETTSHTWIQRLLGAYLSQELSAHHRCAVQLFDGLINLQKRKGSFAPEEVDILLEFYEKHSQKPKPADWKRLALEMGRRVTTIQDKTRRLVHENHRTQRRFTLDEDFKILKYLHENSDISSVTSLKSVTRTSLYPLVNVLQRAGNKIANHWMNSILPNILAHLYGAAHLQWKEEFLKYLVDEKIPSISDVHWQDVFNRWPFLTKLKASVYLSTIINRGKIAPLHEQAVEGLCQLKTTQRETTKTAIQYKEDIIDIYDFIVGHKSQLTRITEIKLSSSTLITE